MKNFEINEELNSFEINDGVQMKAIPSNAWFSDYGDDYHDEDDMPDVFMIQIIDGDIDPRVADFLERQQDGYTDYVYAWNATEWGVLPNGEELVEVYPVFCRYDVDFRPSEI